MRSDPTPMSREPSSSRGEPSSARSEPRSPSHASATRQSVLVSRVDDRSKRIVETAIELAARDGFAAVRLRDVAAQAKVALGTVYKRFASKEEILVVAMQREGERMLAQMTVAPPGEAPLARSVWFFDLATRASFRRPNLAKPIHLCN